MQQKIRIKRRPGYLLSEVTGPFDAREAKNALAQVLEASARHKIPRILVDITSMKGPEPGTMERFEIAKRLAAYKAGPVRMVLLGSEKQVWRDKFFENTAQNRGAVFMETNDLNEALAWLGVKPPAAQA